MPLLARPPGPPVAIVVSREGLAFTLLDFLLVEGQAVPPVFEFPVRPAGTRFAGFWYELLDSHGQVLYRATGADPLGASVEFSGEEGLQRMRAPAGPVRFRLLVPLSVAMQGARLRIYSLETALMEDRDPVEPIADLAISISDGDLDDHQ